MANRNAKLNSARLAAEQHPSTTGKPADKINGGSEFSIQVSGKSTPPAVKKHPGATSPGTKHTSH